MIHWGHPPGGRPVTDPTVQPATEDDFVIPEGIVRSKAAIRAALPELLASWWTRGKWVCYHREERIGVGRDYFALEKKCIDRGISGEEYYIARIAPGAASDEEEEIAGRDV